MAYPLPTTRRRRRRRVWWLLALVTAVAVISALAVRFIAERSRVSDYLDTAREVALVYEALAVRTDTLIGGLETADRASIITVLEETDGEAATAEKELLDMAVPESALLPAGFITVAVASWRTGLGQMGEAVLGLMADAEDLDAENSLRGAFLNFRVGDRAYAQFLTALEGIEQGNGSSYPPFAFVPPELELRYDAALVSDRLAAMESLAIRHDVAVSDVRFDPPPVGDRDGNIVIPFSPTLDVEATVVNRGNEPEAQLPARLRLISEEQDILFEDSRTIESLEPGMAVNLLFTDLPVEPGQFYEVLLSVDLAIDIDPASNQYSQVFYRNDSA